MLIFLPVSKAKHMIQTQVTQYALGFFKPVTTSVLPQSTESTMSFKIDVFLTVGWGGGEVLSFCKLLIYS